jgi:hypothetical protein
VDGEPRYFVDENVIGLARALAEARDDVVHPGHPDLPDVPLGTLDPDWIPVVAKLKLVVLTRDKRMRYKPGERQLLLNGGFRVVALTGTKNMTTWEMLALVVRQWHKLEKLLKDQGPGPWWASWTAGGIARQE